MKIFYDTNIFLDLLLKRERVKSAKTVIQSVLDGSVEGYISDITLLNIDYIAKKQVVDIRSFLYLITEHFKIVGAENKEMNDALLLTNKDLEDNLQYILAKTNHCHLIITNDKKFIETDIKVISSDRFNIKKAMG